MSTNLPVVIRVEVPGVTGSEASRSSLLCAMKAMSAAETLLGNYGVKVGEKIHFGLNEVTITVTTNDDLAPLKQTEITSAVRQALNLIDEVKARYTAAYKSQIPIERTPIERHVLAFNRSAYALSKLKGSYLFLARSANEQRFEPVDPRTLECPEPTKQRIIHIENAIVTGSRDADGHQPRLPFDGADDIDALVSVRHDEITDMLYPTTLDAGQNYWKGTTRMSCDVLVESGKVSRIIGEAVFTRQE